MTTADINDRLAVLEAQLETIAAAHGEIRREQRITTQFLAELLERVKDVRGVRRLHSVEDVAPHETDEPHYEREGAAVVRFENIELPGVLGITDVEVVPE